MELSSVEVKQLSFLQCLQEAINHIEHEKEPLREGILVMEDGQKFSYKIERLSK